MIKNIECDKLEKKYLDKIINDIRINRKNVSFQANKEVPLQRLFKYKEGFSKEIINIFLDDAGIDNGIVLDPFAGSGTTGFVSQERGLDSIGIELLPVGNFAIKAQKLLYEADFIELKRIFDKVKKIDFLNSEIDEQYKQKHIPITEKAYPIETENKINAYLTYIEKNYEETNKIILKYALFTVLESISYTRKDGQYLRWDSRSGKTKGSFNKGKILTFEEALFKKFDDMLNDISLKKLSRTGTYNVIQGSSLFKLSEIDNESIDVVISSPPYCNRYDYTRTYALELVFLGKSDEEIKLLRQSMLSCTVENKSKRELLKKLYDKKERNNDYEKIESIYNECRALQEVIKNLEILKNEGKLNNKNICDMVQNYFYEHAFIIYEMSRVLKKSGKIYYVNDNVRYGGEVIPVDLILCEFAEKSGLHIKNIIKLEKGKGNSSQQMGEHGREEVRKCVYLWEK